MGTHRKKPSPKKGKARRTTAPYPFELRFGGVVVRYPLAFLFFTGI